MIILISSQAQSEFTDTIHELGHLAESYNGEKMASVRGALFSWYVDKNGYSSLEDMIGKFQEDYGTSRENAIEEMTNEALSGLFSTDDGVNDFLNWLKEDSGYSKAEKKSVLQRIIDFFDRIVEAVKQTIKDGDLSQTAREFAQMQADKAAQIREMFLKALDGIDGKKRKNTAEETKNSIKKTKDISYDEQIEKVFSKHFGRSDSLYIGKPSDKLIKAGFSNAPFAMNQSDIRKSHEATAKNKNYSRHGVSKEFFEQLPSKINNAVMFIVNKNGTTVITDYQMSDRNGEKSFVVAGVWHNQKMENDTVNQIKSVYPLDNFVNRVFKAADESKLVISDTKKAQAMLATVGVQSSEVSRLLELSNDSISQTGDDVKRFSDIDSEVKNSLKRTDSEETKNSRKKSYVSRDGHFLSYRETGGSDAHEQALRWAARNSVEDGDLRLAYCKEAWYIIEKDSNDYAGYQVLERIRKGEYDNERRRVEEYNRRNKRRTVSGEFAEYDFGSEQRVRYGDERYGFDINGTGYETKSGRVLSVDRSSSQRGKTRIESGQNTFGGNENRTGTGTERLTDSEVKNSLRHSLGISDSTTDADRPTALLDEVYDTKMLRFLLLFELNAKSRKRHRQML